MLSVSDKGRPWVYVLGLVTKLLKVSDTNLYVLNISKQFKGWHRSQEFIFVIKMLIYTIYTH